MVYLRLSFYSMTLTTHEGCVLSFPHSEGRNGGRKNCLHKIRPQSLVQMLLVRSEKSTSKTWTITALRSPHLWRPPRTGHIPNLVRKEARNTLQAPERALTDRAVCYFGAGSTETEISVFSWFQERQSMPYVYLIVTWNPAKRHRLQFRGLNHHILSARTTHWFTPFALKAAKKL